MMGHHPSGYAAQGYAVQWIASEPTLTASPERGAVSPLAQFDVERSLVRERLRQALSGYRGGVYSLVEYHLGWRDTSGNSSDDARGKMLRPLLCLAAASGYGDALRALDMAAAVELLHAFSLVHDDIEDGDTRRHHRPTVWALYGVPLAINAGDCLFALAHRVLDDAVETLAPDRAIAALRLFDDACLRMIEGQHFDLEFESSSGVSLEQYLAMSAGKTGALIGASLALGALASGAPEADVDALQKAGLEIGLAFQAVDDSLSVWGDESATGKTTGNDGARGKKSLPVVLARRSGLEARDAAVREQTLAVAMEHSLRVDALLDQTAMALKARRSLGEIVTFILRREC